MFKYGVFAGLYCPVIGMNADIYSENLVSVRIIENTDQKKFRIWVIFTQQHILIMSSLSIIKQKSESQNGR